MELALLSAVITCLLIIPNQLSSSPLTFAAPAGRGGRRYPYAFMTGDAKKALARRYDYIIVGGGATGCPLAATLSRKYSVLLLERGDSPYGITDVPDELSFLDPFHDVDMEVFSSVAQSFVTEDGVDGARGRVLGGSSAINAGFYSEASDEEIGDMGLNKTLVKLSYEWVQRVVASRPCLGPWQRGLRDALLEEGVLPYNGYTLEHKHGTKISASTFDDNGTRHSAADLLIYANPDNIVVLLNATAKRVLFSGTSASEDKPRAVGVEVVNPDYTEAYNVSLKENGEVILSAGAIGSPQVLLLSGIGPSKQLQEFGIEVIVDLPGVGQNIADIPRSDIFMLSRRRLQDTLVQVVGIPKNLDVYIEGGNLIDEVNTLEGIITYAHVGWILQKVAHPRSRGWLRLQSIDPRDNISVRYNYYSEPHDLEACIRGARLMATLNASDFLQRFAYDNASDVPHYLLPEFAKFGPAFPADWWDHAALGRFCKESLVTIWHYHGGCQIGSVIDEKNRVSGVDGLRVADASVFDRSPGTNPQATYMMYGRYKGVEIISDRLASATSYRFDTGESPGLDVY